MPTYLACLIARLSAIRRRRRADFASPFARPRETCARTSRPRRGLRHYAPWQRLYFRPLPHGHGALRAVAVVTVTGARRIAPST